MSDDNYRPVDGLDVELRDQVLRLRLDRPTLRNAINDVMMAALIDAVDAAGRDEGVRVISITGSGDHFCGGADIVARNAGSGSKPRAGSIQRRLPSQAHRLHGRFHHRRLCLRGFGLPSGRSLRFGLLWDRG